MRGKRLPPKKQVGAVLRDIKRKSFPFPDITTVAVQCSHCGQGLPSLLRIPPHILYPRHFSNPPSTFFRPPPVASPNNLYIERGERHGWRRDENTLRPTHFHLERQQRAREEVRTQPPTETTRTRQSLASRSRKISGNFFSRPLGKGGDPWIQIGAGTVVELAPERIECPQCHAIVRVAAKLAPHGDVK
jgi:hypothetical protein